MINEVYELVIYSDETGKEPFTEWLESLQRSDLARVNARLTRVISGNLGDYKPLKDGLYELRFLNHGGYRIYYGCNGNTIIILLTGGNKETQKKDIEKAKVYLNDYNKRKVGV